MASADSASSAEGMPVGAFRERARAEAERYGPDPWVFVRELLQNARDAGATTVEFSIEETAEHSRIRCSDDGDGMTLAHARRYLFVLYASSKEGHQGQAGRFGVGFWSVLRFDPSLIIIRSCSRRGPGWGLQLDGDLRHASFCTGRDQRGTEVVLERSGADGLLRQRVHDAAWQNARFLCQRDRGDLPLVVRVNGVTVNAAFALPAPSVSFRARGIKGVVGLGPSPRIELFSRGLRVRAAVALDDLLGPHGRRSDRARVAFPEVPGGLAPQAILECEGLELLLSRTDARHDANLVRLVRTAHAELARLIDHELAHARPRNWWRTLWDRTRLGLRESLIWRALAAAGCGFVLAFAMATLLWGGKDAPPTMAAAEEAIDAQHFDPFDAAAGLGPRQSYADLGSSYAGPRVDVLGSDAGQPTELTYGPAHLTPRFAAFRFTSVAPDGSPNAEPLDPAELATYRGATCTTDCLSVSLRLAAEPGPMRIPVATGHRLDPSSVELDGRRLEVFATRGDHPTLLFRKSVTGLLRYRSAPAADPYNPQLPGRSRVISALWPDLFAHIQSLPITDRAAVLRDRVRQHVRYDRTAAVAEQHQSAEAAGQGFLSRTLAIGAGDCDIQNGLLMAVLAQSSIPARLAVGYVAEQGSVAPWLHAWVEYRDEDGWWHVADASTRLHGEPPGDQPNMFPLAAPNRTLAVAAAPNPPAHVPLASDRTLAPASADPTSASAATVATWVQHRVLAHAWWWTATFALVLAGMATWMGTRSRTHRALQLSGGKDLSQLLRGALQEPAAFRGLPAIFHRDLVPCIGKAAISLARARSLAARGQLYAATSTGNALVPRAGRRAAIIDMGAAEGRIVADAFAAHDLDRWRRILDAADDDHPLIRAVNHVLRLRVPGWTVCTSAEIHGQPSTLDLKPLGIDVAGARKGVVVLPSQDPAVKAALEGFARSPRRCVFTVIDIVAPRLGLPDREHDRIVAAIARAALREIVEGVET